MFIAEKTSHGESKHFVNIKCEKINSGPEKDYFPE